MMYTKVEIKQTVFALLIAITSSACLKKQQAALIVETMDTFNIYCKNTPTLLTFQNEYHSNPLSSKLSKEDSIKADGHYNFFYDESFLEKAYELDIENHKVNGSCTFWLQNGQKLFEGFIDNQTNEGSFTTWKKTGEVFSKTYYEKDKNSLTIQEYFDSGSMKKEVVHFGHEPMEERTFYEDGTRKSETFFTQNENAAYLPKLTVHWDSIGRYDRAFIIKHLLMVPDRQYPGEFYDSIVLTNIEWLQNLD